MWPEATVSGCHADKLNFQHRLCMDYSKDMSSLYLCTTLQISAYHLVRCVEMYLCMYSVQYNSSFPDRVGQFLSVEEFSYFKRI